MYLSQLIQPLPITFITTIAYCERRTRMSLGLWGIIECRKVFARTCSFFYFYLFFKRVELLRKLGNSTDHRAFIVGSKRTRTFARLCRRMAKAWWIFWTPTRVFVVRCVRSTRLANFQPPRAPSNWFQTKSTSTSDVIRCRSCVCWSCERATRNFTPHEKIPTPNKQQRHRTKRKRSSKPPKIHLGVVLRRLRQLLDR